MVDGVAPSKVPSRDLLVVVPTRGRPQNAQRLAQRVSESTRAAVVFLVDNDDSKMTEYLALAEGWLAMAWPCYVIESPRGNPGIVSPLNWFVQDEDLMDLFGPLYLSFMGDDHLPQSAGWDLEVIKSLDFMETGMCYGNDLFQGERLATAIFMTLDIVDCLGWMAPPELNHLFVDDAWMFLGNGIGRLEYLPEVIIEHCHPLAGKSSWDETYQECNNPNAIPDRLAFDEWKRRKGPESIQKLLRMLG